MPLAVSTNSLAESERVFLWIRKNRGVCSRIAKDLDLSHTFVRSVLYGHVRSSELRVEKALINAGAAFVSERFSEGS